MPADLYRREDSLRAPAGRKGVLRFRPAAVLSWLIDWRRKQKQRALVAKLQRARAEEYVKAAERELGAPIIETTKGDRP